jgi:hypothetical protein
MRLGCKLYLEALNLSSWLFIAVLAVLMFFVIELEKAIWRKQHVRTI